MGKPGVNLMWQSWAYVSSQVGRVQSRAKPKTWAKFQLKFREIPPWWSFPLSFCLMKLTYNLRSKLMLGTDLSAASLCRHRSGSHIGRRSFASPAPWCWSQGSRQTGSWWPTGRPLAGYGWGSSGTCPSCLHRTSHRRRNHLKEEFKKLL